MVEVHNNSLALTFVSDLFSLQIKMRFSQCQNLEISRCSSVLEKFSQTITKNNEFENRKLRAVLSGKHLEEEIRIFFPEIRCQKVLPEGKTLP